MGALKITLYGLTKVSLNAWYSGKHWSKRVKLKNDYKMLIKSQFKGVFRQDNRYNVTYDFVFRIKPLDASNCVAMVKLIEDVIFKDDAYNIVESIKISSRKGSKDAVSVTIEKID